MVIYNQAVVVVDIVDTALAAQAVGHNIAAEDPPAAALARGHQALEIGRPVSFWYKVINTVARVG